MFITPLRKGFTESIKRYIDEMNLNPPYIKVMIDIQNLSLGQYDPKVSESYYLDDNINLNEILEQLLYWISIKHNEIYHEIGIKPKFILYTDSGRNIFNETLIPGWKEDRKKSYLKLKQQDPYSYSTLVFAKQAIDSIINALHQFINKSTVVKLYNLQYIDSDFIPAYENIKDKDSLILLLSSDHDYIHMINDPNVIRYVFLNSKRDKLQSDIEHMYNSYILVAKKYGLQIEEAKLVQRYYQVFHCLIGDSSDNVKSLIHRKGIKYWIKHLKDVLPKYTIEEIRQMVFENKCFIDELSKHKANSQLYKSFYPKPETKWDEFRLRFFIFDFYATSNIILKSNYYDKVKTELYKLSNIITEVHNSIHRYENESGKLNVQDSIKLFEQLRFTNTEYISKSLFY